MLNIINRLPSYHYYFYYCISKNHSAAAVVDRHSSRRWSGVGVYNKHALPVITKRARLTRATVVKTGGAVADGGSATAAQATSRTHQSPWKCRWSGPYRSWLPYCAGHTPKRSASICSGCPACSSRAITYTCLITGCSYWTWTASTTPRGEISVPTGGGSAFPFGIWLVWLRHNDRRIIIYNIVFDNIDDKTNSSRVRF